MSRQQEIASTILTELLEEAAFDAADFVQLKCRIGQRRFIPPLGEFAEFWYRTGKSLRRDLGAKGKFVLTAGLLQFTIYAPEQWGRGCSMTLAKKLKERFERSILTRENCFVLLDGVNAFELPNPHGGRNITIVDSTFNYYEPERELRQ